MGVFQLANALFNATGVGSAHAWESVLYLAFRARRFETGDARYRDYAELDAVLEFLNLKEVADESSRKHR